MGIEYTDPLRLNEQLSDVVNHFRSAKFLKTMIKSGKSFPVLGVGDSTMTTSSNWLAQAFKNIGTKYGYNVKHAQMNYSKLDYDAWESLNTVGEDMHLKIANGKAPRQLTKAEIPTTSPDLHCEFNVALDTWADGSSRILFGRYGGIGARCWYVTISATNALGVYWSPDGTNLVGTGFGVSVTSNVNGQAYWYKITVDVDDGAGHYVAKCYTSSDGSTWTLEQTVTGGAGSNSSIFDHATQPYSIGGGASSTTFSGKFYELRIRDGIDGKIISPQPIDSWCQVAGDASNGIIVEGTPTIYIYNSAISGYSIGSYIVPSFFNKAIPNLMCPLVVESLSYNEAYYQGVTYLASLDSFIASLINALKYPVICLIGQAPTISPATYIQIHARRVSEIMAYANLKNYDAISFYEAFMDSGYPLSSLVDADGLHPSSTLGQPLMRDAVQKYFDI